MCAETEGPNFNVMLSFALLYRGSARFLQGAADTFFGRPLAEPLSETENAMEKLMAGFGISGIILRALAAEVMLKAFIYRSKCCLRRPITC